MNEQAKITTVHIAQGFFFKTLNRYLPKNVILPDQALSASVCSQLKMEISAQCVKTVQS